MRAWCPRCDAVRPGQTSCPVCATPLATLDDAAAAGRAEPPPELDPAPPPARPRLRIALAVATLALAGLAFVAGRSIARPAAAPAAAAPATTTTTTTPEPGADQRVLNWSARAGDLSVTAVDAIRQGTERRETVASITFRIDGLPSAQRVLALRGLRLLDSGGGVYATVEDRELGREEGVPVQPVDGDQGAYRVVTGPAPRLSSLARIELTGVVAVAPRDRTIQLDTSGPWPPGPEMRVVVPGPRDSLTVPGADLGFEQLEGMDLQLRVSSAFVRDGRAVVVVDASSGFRGVPGELLPIGAELRAGDRVLCSRQSLLGEDPTQQPPQGIVVSCPTGQVPRLTVAIGVGARIIPFDVTLTP